MAVKIWSGRCRSEVARGGLTVNLESETGGKVLSERKAAQTVTGRIVCPDCGATVGRIEGERAWCYCGMRARVAA